MSRWVITSTWGQHHVCADNEAEAEAIVADEGYTVLDGLNAQYTADEHGEWEGDSMTPQAVGEAEAAEARLRLRGLDELGDMEHSGSWGESPADGEDQYDD